jgi:protein TonB
MRDRWHIGWTQRALRRAFVISVVLHGLVLLVLVLAPVRTRPVVWPGPALGVSLVALAGPAGGAPGGAPGPAPGRTAAPPAERKRSPKPSAKAPVKPRGGQRTAQPVPVPEAPADSAEAAAGSPAGSGAGPRGGGGGSPLQLSAQAEGGGFVYDYYLQTVSERISQSWQPPAELAGRGGETAATIRFRILANGRVSTAEVEQASALEVFDRHARDAVLRAQPFPPLPPTYGGRWLLIHLRFAFGETPS